MSVTIETTFKVDNESILTTNQMELFEGGNSGKTTGSLPAGRCHRCGRLLSDTGSHNHGHPCWECEDDYEPIIQ